MKRKPFFEIVPAKKYYGAHATGSVLLRNGHPEYHASTREVKRSHREYLKKMEKMLREVK
jgi:hypothetical protein